MPLPADVVKNTVKSSHSQMNFHSVKIVAKDITAGPRYYNERLRDVYPKSNFYNVVTLLTIGIEV